MFTIPALGRRRQVYSSEFESSLVYIVSSIVLLPVCICAPHVCLVWAKVRRGLKSPGARATDGCEHPTEAGNSAPVLCNSSKCSHPQSHLSSPVKFLYNYRGHHPRLRPLCLTVSLGTATFHPVGKFLKHEGKLTSCSVL